MLDIQPGQKVHVKIVKQPTALAAGKTLRRLLNKDAEVKSDLKRLTRARARNYTPRMRGGRLYGGQRPKIHPVTGKLGEEGTIIATADVIRDLGSVERFIEVKAV